jgi:hypothetical protein
MITLTADQKAIASQIIKTVFGAVRNASQIVCLRVYGETVEIVTTDSLWTLGRDYFKTLVTQFKAATAPKAVATQSKRQPQSTVQLSDRLWEVTGQTGNSYLIHNGRCTCKAAQYGRTCYHLKAVQAAA